MLSGLLLTNPVRPTWKWDFTTGKAPSGATYTGNSGNGTYVNSAGVITASTNNSPRFDYDPATLSPLGYLAEMASTNRVTQSGDFSGYTLSSVAVSTDGTLAPNGSSSFQKLTSAAGSASHYARTGGGSVTLNDVFNISVFIKQGTERYCTLGDAGASAWHLVTFDFQTGTFASSANATGSARQFASGVWRISMSIVASNTHTVLASVGFGSVASNTSSIQNYTAVGTETGYAWGLQSETVGVGCTSLIPTAGSTVTRAQDVLSLPLTSLPGWSATQGGVLVAAYRLHTLRPATIQSVGWIQDNAQNNGVRMAANYVGSGFIRTVLYSGGAAQAQIPAGTVASPANFTRFKQAFGWGTGGASAANNGTLAATTAGPLLLPVSLTTFYIGSDDNSSGALNGTLESIAYYRGARSDAFVQAVSR